MKLSLFLFPVIFFVLPNTVNAQAFQLRGDTLVGEHANDSFGHSVSMNSEGDIIAIGAANNSGNGQGAGSVQVLKWNDSAWVQMGQDIDGDFAGGWFGASVHISDSGNVVVVGSPLYDGVDYDRGMVRAYFWDGTNWIPRGAKINGPTSEAWAGTSVSISGDGNTIVYGAPRVKGPGNALWTGQARVYSWNGNSWTLKGNKFDGANSNAWLGASVDLSHDGNTLAISSHGEFLNNSMGVVAVYDWDSTSWVLKGSKITSSIPGGAFGTVFSLSNDGNTVAISNPEAPSGEGYVQVYDYVNNVWQQRGSTLLGDQAEDEFGVSLDLSDDGNSLVVGATAYQRTQQNSSVTGYARAFRWSGSAWDSTGTVYGKPGLFNFGSGVAINKYGNTIIVGEKETQNTPSQIAGRAYIFALGCKIEASVTDNSPVFIANHAGGTYQWYRCDSTGFVLMPGDTSQQFEATVNGQYAVVVRDSNCVDTSACFSAFNVGLPEVSAPVFYLYPNPASNEFSIKSASDVLGIKGSIYNLQGKLVQQFQAEGREKNVSVKGLSPGVYLVVIGNYQTKLLVN